MCGADYPGDISDGYHTGSSPRVRSRHVEKVQADTQKGIISACAEQTSRRSGRWIWGWDHLRVCGADLNPVAPDGTNAGSSPRVRSRREQTLTEADEPGIISACAEQTNSLKRPEPVFRDHLRVCGADLLLHTVEVTVEGSSPRVRSRQPARPESGSRTRIISACAEQTWSTHGSHPLATDHLRVCGADP